MMPPFYLGVAVCDLYKQELAASAEEEVRCIGCAALRWFGLVWVGLVRVRFGLR